MVKNSKPPTVRVLKAGYVVGGSGSDENALPRKSVILLKGILRPMKEKGWRKERGGEGKKGKEEGKKEGRREGEPQN
jgi:hypothetical protein